MNNNNLNTQNNSSNQVNNTTSLNSNLNNQVPGINSSNGVLNNQGMNNQGGSSNQNVNVNNSISGKISNTTTGNAESSVTNSIQGNANLVKNNSNQIPNDDNSLKIEETSTIRSQKGTVAIASLTNEGVNILTDKLPEAIDISIKAKKIVEKNGKKVRIMTKRELITNIVLSVIFVIAICAGGYGVYYYFFGHNPRNFETKNIKVEYGSTIPESVLNYINLTDISEPDYTLDLSAVKEEIGTYTYKVSYGNTVKTGTITIEDTKAPEITFKDNLEFAEGSNITKDMLVKECSDLSDCNYELTSSVDTNNVGEIEASITATDNFGNTKDYPITIKIYEKLVEMICHKNDLDQEKMVINVSEYDGYFKRDKTFKNGKYREIVTIPRTDNYNALKDSYLNNGYKLDDGNKQATKESNIDNISNLTNQEEIKTHLESNGYICRIVE